jgi:hypothetical protein
MPKSFGKLTEQPNPRKDSTMENLDIASLSAADLAKLLAAARKAEKEKKGEIAALPSFAFLIVLVDGSTVQWSGKAQDKAQAMDSALAHAAQDGKEVFKDSDGNPAIIHRPLPQPRGRKPKAATE